mgnify:CR=1 FL=1
MIETETCTHCLKQIYESIDVWVHLDSVDIECHEDDSPGTIAEPRI